MHEVLVNRLGDLSLPRKSVIRLTDRPDMTLDVYRGRKTTMQQQKQQQCTGNQSPPTPPPRQRSPVIKCSISTVASYLQLTVLTLKALNKNCSRRHFNFLRLSFEKIRLDFSCESSSEQRIHLKHQVLFSLKNNEKLIMNVVCCCRD